MGTFVTLRSAATKGLAIGPFMLKAVSKILRKGSSG